MEVKNYKFTLFHNEALHLDLMFKNLIILQNSIFW